MRLTTLLSILLISTPCLSAENSSFQIDPDAIDSQMRQVMYSIKPTDIKVSAYTNGFPSSLSLKLCDNCSIKSYRLPSDAPLLLNEVTLEPKDLTISLIKKKFDSIQLGINRDTASINYLYLGGISELTPEQIAQEQENEK